MASHETESGSVKPSGEGSELRHYARRGLTIETGSNIEIVDRAFDYVRCILPYDYSYTSNSQQWDEARRICEALEGPMSALGVAQVHPLPEPPRAPQVEGEGSRETDKISRPDPQTPETQHGE